MFSAMTNFTDVIGKKIVKGLELLERTCSMKVYSFALGNI